MVKIYDQMKELAQEFLAQQEIFETKGTKAANKRARKAAGEFKHLMVAYRKQSVADDKK